MEVVQLWAEAAEKLDFHQTLDHVNEVPLHPVAELAEIQNQDVDPQAASTEIESAAPVAIDEVTKPPPKEEEDELTIQGAKR